MTTVVHLHHVDRALLLAFAAVVLSFVSATFYSEHRTAAIEAAAISIQGSAAPRIRRLANARAELRRLQLLIHRAVDHGVPFQRQLEIEAGRELLDEELVQYKLLPMYPDEAARLQSVQAAIGHLNENVNNILTALEAGDLTRALAWQDRLDGSSETLARILSNGIAVNATEAAELAQRISENRRRGVAWAVGLDGVGVVLASLAAALALTVSRAHRRAVQAHRELAERKAEELDAFAMRLAHDIRSPLTTAHLALDTFNRQGFVLDERARRLLGRGERALDQTVKIVEALLEFARAGARAQLGASASVADVSDDVADVVNARAEQIKATVTVRAGGRPTVACSEGALASAIGNLVGNALTYVEGAATREVVIEIVEQRGEVTTTVSDTGPGLSPGADPASLFEPYVRGKDARGRGLGLGLATVKRIVNAHGGQVGVQSSPRGCRFWFTLPVASAKEIRIAEPAVLAADGLHPSPTTPR
ncbi:MAG TPA: HAMP domain-containing sensor histidine kinase [Polyangia bacterium]|nr:HAMP domain-containing sensor histidine kinase [Polyangia bacterium]